MNIETTKWLIWSHEHLAWWGHARRGYVSKRSDAGKYSFKEACDIVENANFGLDREPHEAMVLDS